MTERDAFAYSQWIEEALGGPPPLIRLSGKSPIDEEWTRGPRLDPNAWREVLREWSGNLGLVAGALRLGGYLVIVDADARVEGFADSLATLYEMGLPRETVTVLTGGGGVHLYYVSPTPVAKGPLAEFPGIDIQGEGSQVVVPHSLHESGRVYEWEFNYGPGDVPVAMLPPKLVDLFGAPRSRTIGSARIEPTAEDRDALRILKTYFGAHDEKWTGSYFLVTRPGKSGGSGSATIGAISPGGVHVFTSAWDGLPPGNYSPFQLATRAGETAARSERLSAAIPNAPAPNVETVKLSDVETERVSWLWPWRVPLGKLVMLDGDPGLGKSTLTLAIASVVTRGLWFPDGHGTGHPSNVLLLTGEDGLADTVRPRLDACGGDPERVTALRGQYVETKSGDRYLDLVTLPSDLRILEDVIHETSARLVIVDPLAVFTKMKGDSYRDSDMRGEVLGPLSALAERASCAVLCVRHLTKSHGSNPLYAGGGSIAMTAASRLALLVAPHPVDPGLRVLAVAKSNLSPIAPSLAFALVSQEGQDAARVEWRGEAPYSAAELLRGSREASAGDEEKRDVETVSEWIREVISENGGEVASRDLAIGAKVKGFSGRTMDRARKALGVRARHGKDERTGRGAWWVSLPDPPTEDEPAPANQDRHEGAWRSDVLGSRGARGLKDFKDATDLSGGLDSPAPWRIGRPGRAQREETEE